MTGVKKRARKTMVLIDSNKLRDMTIRENKLIMERLNSLIFRVEKEEAIPVNWLQKTAEKYKNGGHEVIAGVIYKLIEEYENGY